jgi:hypothetical protein
VGPQVELQDEVSMVENQVLEVVGAIGGLVVVFPSSLEQGLKDVCGEGTLPLMCR